MTHQAIDSGSISIFRKRLYLAGIFDIMMSKIPAKYRRFLNIDIDPLSIA